MINFLMTVIHNFFDTVGAFFTTDIENILTKNTINTDNSIQIGSKINFDSERVDPNNNINDVSGVIDSDVDKNNSVGDESGMINSNINKNNSVSGGSGVVGSGVNIKNYFRSNSSSEYVINYVYSLYVMNHFGFYYKIPDNFNVNLIVDNYKALFNDLVSLNLFSKKEIYIYLSNSNEISKKIFDEKLLLYNCPEEILDVLSKKKNLTIKEKKLFNLYKTLFKQVQLYTCENRYINNISQHYMYITKLKTLEDYNIMLEKMIKIEAEKENIIKNTVGVKDEYNSLIHSSKYYKKLSGLDSYRRNILDILNEYNSKKTVVTNDLLSLYLDGYKQFKIDGISQKFKPSFKEFNVNLTNLKIFNYFYLEHSTTFKREEYIVERSEKIALERLLFEKLN